MLLLARRRHRRAAAAAATTTLGAGAGASVVAVLWMLPPWLCVLTIPRPPLLARPLLRWVLSLSLSPLCSPPSALFATLAQHAAAVPLGGPAARQSLFLSNCAGRSAAPKIKTQESR